MGSPVLLGCAQTLEDSIREDYENVRQASLKSCQPKQCKIGSDVAIICA